MSQNNSTSYIQSSLLKRFTIIKKVGSGAYGHVWKVQQKATKKIFALKKIFDAFQHSTDAQRTFREVQILQQTSHPNIIKLFETMRAENNKDVYLLFQFMEADLHNVISEGILKEVHIRFIIYQIAKALKYLHSGLILHRDLKPSNILINSNCSIKLCDFGLVRSLYSVDQSNPVLTEGVATRWYRAPQVLLGSKCYSTPADIWSFGCIIYQVICEKPLFPGNSVIDQLDKIVSLTGFPSQQDIKSLESEVAKNLIKQLKNQHQVSQVKSIMKNVSPQMADFLMKILVFNPKKRLTIDQILSHPLVKNFRKKDEQFVSQKIFTTSIDDNLKVGVDQYRKIIYMNRKSDGNSSSLPNLNSKNAMYSSATKKEGSTSKIVQQQVQQQNNSQVIPQKTTLKNVKSSKQLLKYQSEKKLYQSDSKVSVQKFIPNRKSQSESFSIVEGDKDPENSKLQKTNNMGQIKQTYQKSNYSGHLSSPSNASSKSKITSSKIDPNLKFIPQKTSSFNPNYGKEGINKVGYPTATSFYSPKNIELKKSTTVQCCPFSTKNVVVKEFRPTNFVTSQINNINNQTETSKISNNSKSGQNSGNESSGNNSKY